MTIEHPAAPLHSAAGPARAGASGNGLDLLLAIALIAAGAVALALDRSSGMMTPGLEGGLTTSVLAVALCGVARLPYRSTLATVIALVLIELAAGMLAGLPPTAILGYPLVALGMLGVLKNSTYLRKASLHRNESANAAATGASMQS